MQRRHFSALALGLALTSPAAQAQVRDINDAINKAGRQRMLSQRVAKAYLAMVLHSQVRLADKILAQSMALFDRQLVELKAFAPSTAVRDTYVQLESAWADYKEKLVGKAPSPAGATAVVAQSEAVLALAHKGTGQLEHESGKSLGHLVNVAGRQRMLSQRMAKYSYASAAGIDRPAAHAAIGKARTAFLAGMKTLTDAPEATPRIREQLKLAEQQWVFFDAALSASQKGTATPEVLGHVLTTSENILTVLNDVTGLYAALS